MSHVWCARGCFWVLFLPRAVRFMRRPHLPIGPTCLAGVRLVGCDQEPAGLWPAGYGLSRPVCELIEPYGWPCAIIKRRWVAATQQCLRAAMGRNQSKRLKTGQNRPKMAQKVGYNFHFLGILTHFWPTRLLALLCFALLVVAKKGRSPP